MENGGWQSTPRPSPLRPRFREASWSAVAERQSEAATPLSHRHCHYESGLPAAIQINLNPAFNASTFQAACAPRLRPGTARRKSLNPLTAPLVPAYALPQMRRQRHFVLCR
jgi:hypothetical protein